LIYFLQAVGGGPVKIGTSVNVDVRRKQLEWDYGRSLVLLATLPGGRDEERALHQRFAAHRLGRTEQFRPVPELMEFIGRPLLVGANPESVEVMGVPSELTRVRLELDEAEHRRLRLAAAEENVSLTVLARRLINEALDQRGKARPTP
jgi:hypothetical protein